jgi:hypothetical protein
MRLNEFPEFAEFAEGGERAALLDERAEFADLDEMLFIVNLLSALNLLDSQQFVQFSCVLKFAER